MSNSNYSQNVKSIFANLFHALRIDYAMFIFRIFLSSAKAGRKAKALKAGWRSSSTNLTKMDPVVADSIPTRSTTSAVISQVYVVRGF